MGKVSLDTYLFFERNCQEAMEFYKGVFGGELTTQTRGNVDPEAPEGHEGAAHPRQPQGR